MESGRFKGAERVVEGLARSFMYLVIVSMIFLSSAAMSKGEVTKLKKMLIRSFCKE